MTYEVRVGPRALEDLDAVRRWIAERAGSDIAAAYLARIERFASGLSDLPHRGTPRDDLAPGLRTLAFERRATVAYVVQGRLVTILRVLHAGSDLGEAFDDD